MKNENAPAFTSEAAAASKLVWVVPLATAAYQTYEFLNRSNAIVILFMAAGWLGAFLLLEGFGRWAALVALIGTLLYTFGTAAEFWLYSDLSYNPPNGG